MAQKKLALGKQIENLQKNTFSLRKIYPKLHSHGGFIIVPWLFLLPLNPFLMTHLGAVPVSQIVTPISKEGCNGFPSERAERSGRIEGMSRWKRNRGREGENGVSAKSERSQKAG